MDTRRQHGARLQRLGRHRALSRARGTPAAWPATPRARCRRARARSSTAPAPRPAATRWGDYTSMNVDPVDDCTFWYVNEYLPADERHGLAAAHRRLQVPGMHLRAFGHAQGPGHGLRRRNADRRSPRVRRRLLDGDRRQRQLFAHSRARRLHGRRLGPRIFERRRARDSHRRRNDGSRRVPHGACPSSRERRRR